MSFQTNIPVNAQSPSLFPAQCRNNWLRLQEVVETEHQFTAPLGSSNGYHKVITFIQQAGDPAVKARGQLYTKSYTPTESSTSPAARDSLFYEDTLGNVLQLTPFGASFGIRLAGKVNLGAGAISSDITIGSFNYVGFMFAHYESGGSISGRQSAIIRSGALQSTFGSSTTGTLQPSFLPGTTSDSIRIQNTSGSSQDIYYSILYIQSAA